MEFATTIAFALQKGEILFYLVCLLGLGYKSFKLKENMNRLPILHALINDDLILDIEMGSLAKNINKEVYGVIDSSFLLDKI
jgi:hypothetical protein